MVAARRWVLHLDMDAFFASVEQLTRPTLAGRPVLVGGAGGRGVVAGASYQARAFGARSAMPMHQARRLVGAHAVVVPPRGLVYSAVSRRIFRAIRTMVPVIEQLSFDEAFAEPEVLVGATVDDVRAFAERLRALVRDEVGLAASVGAGGGKQIAKIASGMAKPDGVVVISPQEQDGFLEPLSVRKLWGIGPVAGEKLARIGVETIGELAALSTVEVTSVLGATVGPALHRLAQGHDDRKVTERSSAKQISAEHTYAQDLTTLTALREGIDKAGQSAHRRLLADGRGARTVVVKMKKTDMSVLTRSATLTPATTDIAVLMAAARRLALDPLDIGPVRLVGVGFSGLTAVQQYSMFPELDSDGGDPNDTPAEVADAQPATDAEAADETATWSTGADVTHDDWGHGWVQGAGHGVVTVRFETRTTGPGIARTFAASDAALRRADPLASLDWANDDVDDHP